MVLLLCIPIFLVSCKSNTKSVEKETYMMGTIVQLKVYGENSEKATELALKRISDIESKMSVNIKSSEITKLNAKAGVSGEKLSVDTYSVIEKAVKYSKLTDGSLDATIEPIVKLWGIGTDKARIPSKSEIEEKLKLVDYKDIILDSKNSTVQLRRTGQAIDLGAIAKGYTADEIKKVLIDNKVNSALINLGGNVFAVGSKPDGTSWNIGIQNPLDTRGQYLGTISVTDKSMVTSGNYERYFIVDGKRYHHIFDPKTGYPSEAGLISTTIVSDNSIDGDALSTSTYILGLSKGIKLIESIKGVEAIFVTSDKKVYVTAGLKDSFNLTNKEFTYEKR
ncbi:FAD:protein FMN transferase [Clostridium tagluense]|uniref:FAD:protein FMN transferase n=1 Tax=Clostridium tagluense TaxID=360422 RepID=UPI001CF37C71|nr:FAD:protein FMN transferase [Clostridium tagluense]MCB2321346.1 FAD:protein FMN transferase [Clostridium tagluense]MCB2335967.1 FAD:protein FMN transferase [Clostridium tagluense]MCB2364737.1 FAD:protein FMN transferase [Clostridium tagluense]